MRRITKSIWVLSLLVSVVAWPAGVAAQADQYYADCEACANHLGGPGYIGPFSTLDACNAERDIEIKQGFPIGESVPHPLTRRLGILCAPVSVFHSWPCLVRVQAGRGFCVIARR